MTTLDPRSKARFELGVSLIITAWPAMALAVQNQWGGPESSDKRDWLSGALVEMHEESNGSVDQEDIEDVLYQVLQDEFDVNLEDGSAEETAASIVALYDQCETGNFTMVDSLYEKFQKRNNRAPVIGISQAAESESSEEGESDGIEGLNSHEPANGTPDRNGNTKVVDDDGFELVQRNR